MNLRIAHRTEPRVGEALSGDRVYVRESAAGWLLVVIDALGHGPKASAAADAAIDVLAAQSPGRGAGALLQTLDTELRGSRGLAASACVLSAALDHLDGCGVGNVEIRSQGSKIPVVHTPGVIGHGVRRLRTFECALQDGDRIVMFSDGLSARFSLDRYRSLAPQQACDDIFGEYRRDHDDATLLIADVEGTP